MPEKTFYAEDQDGCLRRWHPSPEMLRGNEMARAIRGGTALRDTPELIEFLAGRLTKVYADSEQLDFIMAARERARMLRGSLPESN